MSDFEQLYIRKELEDFIEMPVVLYTLLLEFVGPYEWINLNQIPRGVTCTCMLNMHILVRGKMVLGNIRKLVLYNCKVDVIRTEWVYEEVDDEEVDDKEVDDEEYEEIKDTFTFKFIIGGITRTLTPGIMYVHHSGIDSIVFMVDPVSGVIISNLRPKN